jgi:hypothetical protein
VSLNSVFVEILAAPGAICVSSCGGFGSLAGGLVFPYAGNAAVSSAEPAGPAAVHPLPGGQ